MTETDSPEKSPIEQAVEQAMDAFVYAPIGLVFDGPALFPKLVAKGRNQVDVARMMGRMAVKMGQTEVGKRLDPADGALRDVLVAMGIVAPPGPPPGAQPEATVATTKTTKSSPGRPAQEPAQEPVRKPAAKRAGKPAVSTLGIPDYDSLSASQVVKRLRGMDPADLEAVQAYEAATRARKTILNRIVQIQKG